MDMHCIGRQWYHHLKDCLKKSGWKQNPSEPCMYRRNKNEHLLVYVDDILVISSSKDNVATTKQKLSTFFPIKDLGEIREYLGIEVIRDCENKTIEMRQLGSIESAISKTRQPVHRKWTSASTVQSCVRKTDPASVTEHEWYQSIVGQLSHIARNSLPDIALFVNLICRTMAAPTQQDLLAAHRVQEYLDGTKDMYLELTGHEFDEMKVYSDADWADTMGNTQTKAT